MPELPEVETVMRGLAPSLLYNRIEIIKTYRKNLRIPFPVDLEKRLKNKNILSISRRAKYILIEFEGGDLLVVHLGMSGRISIVPKNAKYKIQKHDHLQIIMQDGVQIIYNDPRRFGMVFIVKKDELDIHPSFSHLGPEPFSSKFSALYLKNSFKNKTTSIKQALLDQRIVVGVGNIYACEALHQIKINPQKKVGQLKEAQLKELVVAVRDVLKRAIKAGGSTLKDYRHADGQLGYFQHNFKVYGREGEGCVNCTQTPSGVGVITRIVQGGRSTFYCPRCQK